MDILPFNDNLCGGLYPVAGSPDGLVCVVDVVVVLSEMVVLENTFVLSVNML